MKATKIAWMVFFRDLFNTMTAEGIEFRTLKGALLDAPGDIWKELYLHGGVNVRFLDTERGENGKTVV